MTVFTDLTTAIDLAEKADEVAADIGDNRLLALSRGTLCWACCWAGDLERARKLGEESVERARQLGDDVLLARSLNVYAAAVGAVASGPLYAEAIVCTERSGDLG